MFNIEYNENPKKYLKKLDKKTKKRILKKIEQVKENPFRFLEHFEGQDCYKLRIGDFRALIDVNFKTQTLYVRVLDKRERIYKR